MRIATGFENPKLQLRLLNQLLSTLQTLNSETAADQVNNLLSVLTAIAPKDGVEGMLAAQMVATHEHAMECLRRAMLSAQSFEGRDLNLKHAAKLLQIYARQVEALDKHRGKGQQKITVEHVTVEAGGQAIVGNVETGAAGAGQLEASAAPAALTDERASEALNASRFERSKEKAGRRKPDKRARD